MKILITGMTASHVTDDYPTMARIPTMITGALRRAGHAVTVRRVTPGEPLSNFDRCLVFIMPIHSLVATKVPSALWALYQRPDSIISMDDWRIDETFNELRRVAEDLRGIEKPRIVAKPGTQCAREAAPLIDQLHEAAKRVMAGKHRFAVFGQTWSDVTAYQHVPASCERILLDPSGCTPLYGINPLAAREKQRGWVLAGTGAHLKPNWLPSLGLRWTVELYGGSQKPGSASAELGFTWLKHESELVNRYNHNWGVLCYPYPKTSQGNTWRIKYPFAAYLGGVVSGEHGEFKNLGPSFQYVPREYEEMSDKVLYYTAMNQRTWFRDNSWTEQKLVKELIKLLKEGS